jgi:hypothetical protein
MKKREQPHRITLWEDDEIDYNHELSDGFGIPAIVVFCPLDSDSDIYSGNDEFGDNVEGVSFDDCMSCEYFGGLGFGQEILCSCEG